MYYVTRKPVSQRPAARLLIDVKWGGGSEQVHMGLGVGAHVVVSHVTYVIIQFCGYMGTPPVNRHH